MDGGPGRGPGLFSDGVLPRAGTPLQGGSGEVRPLLTAGWRRGSPGGGGRGVGVARWGLGDGWVAAFRPAASGEHDRDHDDDPHDQENDEQFQAAYEAGGGTR